MVTDEKFYYRTYTHSASETAKKLWFIVHSVGCYACKPTYNATRDRLFDFQLKYVVRGKGKIIWQGRTFNVRQGEIFFLDLNQKHCYYADPEDPFEVLWVHFGGPQTEEYFRLLDGMNTPVYQVQNHDEIEKIFRQLVELFKLRQVGQEALASSMITIVLTEMIVSRMKRGSTQPSLEAPMYPEPVQQAIYYIETNYYMPLKLEEIAKEILLSPYHFSRLFKQATGYSVMEYVQKFRINHSKYLLTKKEMSIGEIAEKIGFSDQSYFGKLFKRYEKQTPKEYRISHMGITYDSTQKSEETISNNKYDSSPLFVK